MNIRKPTRGGLLLLAALLSGCGTLFPWSGPDYQAPELSVPAQWTTPLPADKTATTPPPQRALAHWWRQLGDAQLDRLIEEALANSPDLHLAQARLRQARASRELAEGGRYPSLSASVNANRGKSPSLPTQNTYIAGFDASWEIDLFGGIQRGVEAARADQAASEASLNQARVSLVAEVAQTYVEVRSYQQRLAIARDNLASQSETAQIVEWRYQAGLTAQSDVEQARASREQTRASLPDLETGRTAAENRLSILLGRHPGSLKDAFNSPAILPALPARIATGIPADTLRQRPDLIAAERTLAAETARIGQKQAQRFPSLNLGASFGWQAYRFSALGTSGALARTLSGTLAALLFDGGKLRSQVEIQNAVQEQALITYQKSVLTALEEVENALKAYAAGHDRVEARRAAAEAAKNAATLTRQMYQSGLSDFQKVLESERTRLTAEDNLATAEASLRTSLIQLYKALGGGWTPDNTKSAPSSLAPESSS